MTASARGRLVTRYTSEFLCARIFERRAQQIRVKKPHVAIGNLVKIVEAFLTLSTQQGFHATSLRDLAEATSLSMGGLYSYFDSKETLLVMVLDEVDAVVRDVMAQAPDEVTADPLAHLLWVVDTHIRLTEVMQPWFVFAYMEAKSFPKAARKAAVESERLIEGIIEDILEKGNRTAQFDVHDTALLASLVKPLLQDWYIKRSKYRRRGIGIDRYIAGVTDMLRSAILP